MTATLDNLADQADTLATPPTDAEGAPGAPGAAAEAPPQLTNYDALCTLLAMGREGVCIAVNVQSLRVTLEDDRVAVLAKAWAAVLDEKGVQIHAMMGGTIGQALAVTAPIAWAVYKGLSAELAARRAPAAAAEPDAIAPAG